MAASHALEIEYGLLKKDPIQRRRCLLCLREPWLPYDQMPSPEMATSFTATLYTNDPGTGSCPPLEKT